MLPFAPEPKQWTLFWNRLTQGVGVPLKGGPGLNVQPAYAGKCTEIEWERWSYRRGSEIGDRGCRCYFVYI